MSQTLRDMRLSVEDEARCPKSGYSIDMWVHDTDALQESGKGSTMGGKQGWAVEFDGPRHFLACGAPTGATLIKRNHLQLLGYTLVSLPYWEWNNVCEEPSERKQYLHRKLQL